MQTNLMLLIVLLVVLSAAAYIFLWPILHQKVITLRPFPKSWLTIIKQRLPAFLHMPPELRIQWLRLIKTFLYSKDFVGCAGLQITEEMKVVIASQACLLLLNRPSHEYRDLRTVLVYPTTFVAKREIRDDLGLVAEQTQTLLGESWSNGKVILAWDDVEKGVRDFQDGQNVVLHEFAHQLDHESGTANGAPLLYRKNAYRTWSKVFSKEFSDLQSRLNNSVSSDINQYGATNPAEFFAVVTEMFFERPGVLHHHHPQLFEQLLGYYSVDPREWL
jgi:Mlc titration factor MtfA (ptsG expression regulator)